MHIMHINNNNGSETKWRAILSAYHMITDIQFVYELRNYGEP